MTTTDINELRVTPAAQPFQPPAALQPMGIESASTALAAQAKAQIEARYVMAMHRPRNMDAVRQTLLHECNRPSFAHNKSAIYKKPIGKGIEGLGIRFVEVALRCMTNILVESSMIFEDEAKELHRVTVTDLECNVTYPQDVKVSKTVERSKPADDGSFISVRKNSYGKEVYTVPASDDDLLNKRGALISKALRTLGLRIIPGDLQDEATAVIKKVRTNKAATDPDAERKRIVDAFSTLNVSAADLSEFLGHEIGKCSPAELVDLRSWYGAIKDGETTWQAIMDERPEASTKPDPEQKDKAESWPTKTKDGNNWVDSDGVVFNQDLHAWSEQQGHPAVKADGTFRARRGMARKQPEAKKETVGDGVTDDTANQQAAIDATTAADTKGPLDTVLSQIYKAQSVDELDIIVDACRGRFTGDDAEKVGQAYQNRVSDIQGNSAGGDPGYSME